MSVGWGDRLMGCPSNRGSVLRLVFISTHIDENPYLLPKQALFHNESVESTRDYQALRESSAAYIYIYLSIPPKSPCVHVHEGKGDKKV